MPHSSAARTHATAKVLTEAAYSRWAPIYDLIFDLPFHPGRLAATRAAVEAAGADGAILVVGVGTGLELGLMPKTVRVTGIDLSAAMLKIARERVARKGLRQVKGLLVMDAGALEFPDAQFDVALAPYVMSVVPNPARVLDEMWRVVRPGGQMIVMNHFAAPGGPRATSKPRWKNPPPGSAGIRNSPMRRSATGSPSAPTPSSSSGASWRRCGSSPCSGFARRGARKAGAEGLSATNRAIRRCDPERSEGEAIQISRRLWVCIAAEARSHLTSNKGVK